MTRNYRELLAWQRALDLIAEINPILDRLPSRERNRLHYQLGRAALSVGLNISEGQGRKGAKEFSHFLGVSRGSLREVEASLDVIERLAYLSATELEPARKYARQTSYLIYKLDRAILKRPPPTSEQNGAEGAVVEPPNLGGAPRRRRTPPPKKSTD